MMAEETTFTGRFFSISGMLDARGNKIGSSPGRWGSLCWIVMMNRWKEKMRPDCGS